MKNTEQTPNSNDPKEYKNPIKDIKGIEEISELMRESRVMRRIVNFTVTSAFYLNIFLTPNGRELLKTENGRRMLFNREGRIGMLEDSIFSYDLYYPNDGGTSLDYKSAAAGRWVGYDFHRKKEFGNKAKQTSEGRLAAFMLEEVKDSGPDDYSPTGLANLYDIDHLFHLEIPPIDDLLKEGFVRETSYRVAFEKVGILDKYKQYLGLAAALEKPVYTVTPKGNGLVGLMRDGGDKVEKRKEVGVLRPVLGF